MRRYLAIPIIVLLEAHSASAAATGSQFSLSPSLVSLSSSDPDIGASTATVISANWTVSGGNKSTTWSLSVKAGGTTMQDCTKVQVSAITITCASVATGSCGSAINLSTQPQVIATGGTPNGNSLNQVQFQLSFADSWSYLATSSLSCTVALQYDLSVN